MHNRIILNLLKTVSHTAKHYALKTIYSATSEFDRNRDIITKKFKEWSYPKNLVHEQVDKVKNMKTKQLLLTNKRPIQSRIRVLITYNRYLPNISKMITKNWNILKISPTLQKVFDKRPMITYKRNKNLVELIYRHTLQEGKVFKTHTEITKD